MKGYIRIDQKLEFQYKENILQGCQKLPEETNIASTETFDNTHDKRTTENQKHINSLELKVGTICFCWKWIKWIVILVGKPGRGIIIH